MLATLGMRLQDDSSWQDAGHKKVAIRLGTLETLVSRKGVWMPASSIWHRN